MKIVHTKLSPNCTKPRKYGIDTITPHVFVGDVPVERMLEYFMNPAVKASANYCIDSNGRIGLGVEEKNRSWCSSNAENDHRAITIELANYKNAPNYEIKDTTIDTFIVLVADICRRYGKTELYFDADKTKPHRGGKTMRITLHKWFKNKECPGKYFISQIPYIIKEVNEILNPKPVKYYRVQVGAYTVKANAEKMAARLKKEGYDVLIV